MKTKGKIITLAFLFVSGFTGAGLYMMARPPAVAPNEEALRELAPEQWTSDRYETPKPYKKAPATIEEFIEQMQEIEKELLLEEIEEMERNHEPQIRPAPFEDPGFPGRFI